MLNEKFLKVKEAAEILHISEHALRRAVRLGTIPAYDFNVKPKGEKKQLVISATDLEAFIKSRRVGAVATEDYDSRRRPVKPAKTFI